MEPSRGAFTRGLESLLFADINQMGKRERNRSAPASIIIYINNINVKVYMFVCSLLNNAKPDE